MSRAERSHGKASVSRLSKDAAATQAMQQAAAELEAAITCQNLAAAVGDGSVMQRFHREEAKRHRELAVRFLLELDR